MWHNVRGWSPMICYVLYYLYLHIGFNIRYIKDLVQECSLFNKCITKLNQLQRWLRLVCIDYPLCGTFYGQPWVVVVYSHWDQLTSLESEIKSSSICKYILDELVSVLSSTWVTRVQNSWSVLYIIFLTSLLFFLDLPLWAA